MRPILLKGHTRPLTHVQFNREGDLLFTSSKDSKPCVWWTHNGERLGTYNGHNGVVWHLDVNFTSTRLLTGAGDKTAKLWDVEKGKELFSFPHQSMVRCVGFALGEQMMLTVQDQSFSSQPSIFIYNLASNIEDQTADPVRDLHEEKSRSNIVKAYWGPLNHTITSCTDDGYICVWDVEAGTQTKKVKAHNKSIKEMNISADGTMIITASDDHTAKLWDVSSLEHLKTYSSDRPLNAAAISPILPHIIVGGGQDAALVTTTEGKAGHFEVDFHHTVYTDKRGCVKGHFGPVNTLAFSPDGKAFASGAEDGYVRLVQFDKSYFSYTD